MKNIYLVAGEQMDIYVCASSDKSVIVSARVARGSTAHARAVRLARKWWPNRIVACLSLEEIGACEKAGKKIELAEGLPSL